MPDNACMPYTSGTMGADSKCSAACSDASKRVLKATSYTTPGSSATAIKTALMKGPLVTTMTVYDDFMSYTKGVYKHVTGAADGGHAVSIVGWSDTDQAWIVRNSWGTAWGMNGFFEIAYTDVSGIGAETWSFTVTAPKSYASVNGLRDNTLFAGTEQVSIETKGLTSPTVSWSLTPNGSSSAAETGTTAAVDTTKVKDGVYLLQAHATAGSTTVASEPRLVDVLNGKPSGTIKITAPKAGATVSGDTNMTFTVNVTPVPLTGIIFTVTNSKGVVTTNDTMIGNTGPSMAIDIGTASRPNGNYTFGIIGLVGTQQVGATSVAVTIKN
jgi:hypothetical protein